METMSTCPNATCSLRTIFGYCSSTTCVQRMNQTLENTGNINTMCDLCKYDLEDGDYLYQRSSQDHAMVFEGVVVHYCPVCGRKLNKTRV